MTAPYRAMPDGNTAALREHDRRESEPFDEDEAERFWEAHDRYMAGYYEARSED